MITFKNFILTEAKRDPALTHVYNPKPVSAQAIVDWCEEHAPQFLRNAKHAQLWRGMGKHVSGIIDTNAFNRKSANTYNYYTLWMDNHPSWKDYPKRSKSLICTTSYEVASGYGAVKLIIPADKNTVGVCASDDLWGAFRHLSTLVGSPTHETSLNTVVMMVHRAIQYQFGAEMTEEAQNKYDVMIECLRAITPKTIRDIQVDDEYAGKKLNNLADILSRNNMNTLYELFEKGLTPTANGFNVIPAHMSYKIDDDIEVWVQGECAVIDVYSVLHAPELQEFCNKYKIPIYQ